MKSYLKSEIRDFEISYRILSSVGPLALDREKPFTLEQLASECNVAFELYRMYIRGSKFNFNKRVL